MFQTEHEKGAFHLHLLFAIGPGKFLPGNDGHNGTMSMDFLRIRNTRIEIIAVFEWGIFTGYMHSYFEWNLLLSQEVVSRSLHEVGG